MPALLSFANCQKKRKNKEKGTMTKKEWIDVLDSAYMKAKFDYNCAEPRTPEENRARLCMNIFHYLSDAIKELE